MGSMQLAIEDSTKTRVVAASALSPELADVNAQVSDALLRCQKGLHVVLHTLSRFPRALMNRFQQNPALSACLHDMEENGLSCQVNQDGRLGPFVFVRPEHHGPLEEALRSLGFELAAFRHWHVFADEELSPIISKIVKALPKKEKVYPRSTSVVPLSFAAEVLENRLDACMLKTFIDIK